MQNIANTLFFGGVAAIVLDIIWITVSFFACVDTDLPWDTYYTVGSVALLVMLVATAVMFVTDNMKG